jgi:hypothetical protein
MNEFKNKLEVLFSKTGDSKLKKYSYKNGKIYLEVELYDDDLLNMVFETEILYCKNIEQRTPFNIGYFECIELSDVVNVENNHYVFSGNFVDIMKAQKNKYNLVFGLNIQNYTHLITFSNSSINLAFVVNEKNNFKYEYIE